MTHFSSLDAYNIQLDYVECRITDDGNGDDDVDAAFWIGNRG